MKRSRLILFTLVPVCCMLVLLAGCGVAQDDYDAALAQVARLESEKATLEASVAALAAEKSSLETDKANLQADKDSLASELADLQMQYDELSADFTAMNDVFPARQFRSYTELINWLARNDVSKEPVTAYAEDWYTRALQLQEDALNDGYIVSVDYDMDMDGYFYIYCTTVINGTIYYWDPETDDVEEETGLINVDFRVEDEGPEL